MNPSSAPAGKLLVVDDEKHQRSILAEAISTLVPVGGGAYQVVTAENGAQALEKLNSENFDVLLTDMQMPGIDGIQLLEKTLELDSSISVIVLTAHGTIETAVEAMKKGAEDYLLKPIEFDALEIVLKRVFGKRALVRENRRLQNENAQLKRNLDIRYHLSNTLGVSHQAKNLLDQIQNLMKSRIPVLILGEIGVGKNDIARMIHFNSPWAANDLILFDCTSVPEDLHEAHLFGEEETLQSDRAPRAGLVEKAHFGTLIVAHIDKLSKKCQPRIARVLTENRTQRIGGKRFYQVDVRIIATTNKGDYEKAIQSNELRSDLFDLFLDNSVFVSPLRERKDDIPILIAATAKQMAQAVGKDILKIEPSVIERLKSYDFPGNNRELKTMVEAAVIRCSDSNLKIEDFSFPPAIQKL